MSIELLTVLFFLSLLVFLLLGLPLSFVLGGVPIVFIYFTWGPEAFYMVAAQTWGAMNKFTLVAIPLFIFMAMILERSGVANDLYEMMYLWFGGLRGGAGHWYRSDMRHLFGHVWDQRSGCCEHGNHCSSLHAEKKL